MSERVSLNDLRTLAEDAPQILHLLDEDTAAEQVFRRKPRRQQSVGDVRSLLAVRTKTATGVTLIGVTETMTSLETLDDHRRLDVEYFVNIDLVVSVYRLGSKVLGVVAVSKHDAAHSS